MINYFSDIDVTDISHRLRFAKMLRWIGGPVLYVYSLYFFFAELYFAGSMIFAAALTISVATFWLFRAQEPRDALYIYNLMVTLFFLFMVLHHTNLIGLNGRVDFIGWVFIYPLLAFFAIGAKGGFIWTVIGLISVITAFLLRGPIEITPDLVFSLRIQLPSAIIGTGLIAYTYERARVRTNKELVKKNKALLASEKQVKDANVQLVREIEDRKKAQTALNKMRDELEVRVRKRTTELTMQIEERKQAQSALVESEERYRALFERSQDCLYVHDFEGRFIDANPVAQKLFGIRHEDIASFGFSDLLGQKQLGQALDTLNELIETGYQKKLTVFKVTDHKGMVVYLETIGSVIHRDGEPYAIQGIARDITERINAEEALYREKENFRYLVESSPFGIGLVGQDGNWKYVNPVFVEIFGYTLDDLLEAGEKFGRGFLKTNFQKDAFFQDASFQPALAVTVKDGGLRQVDLHLGRLESGDKLIFFEDVTEKKTLESRLRQAQKMEAIGTLAGGVAHDLNNILSGILSYPDLLLLDLEKDSPLREPLVTIKRSGERAATIVQDLLALARRGVVIKKVANLNTIVKEYIKSPEHLNLAAHHENIRFVSKTEAGVPNIIGSSVHLLKVMMNLVTNAAEAMPDGGDIHITTETHIVDKNTRTHELLEAGKYSVLKVADTGTGMAEKDAARIFEPFFTTKVMGRSGTGLGMSVVWGTIKDHGGHIEVESLIGKGTTFSIYLPESRKQIETDHKSLNAAPSAGRGETVLIVDDVAEQRKIAADMLKRLGYQTDTAANGNEAILRLNAKSYDLLVLDMIMTPDMDGYATYRQAIKMHSGQKAIITSGFSATKRVKKAQELGAGPYLKKPYSLEELASAVRNELDR